MQTWSYVGVNEVIFNQLKRFKGFKKYFKTFFKMYLC